jgi:hypothetical protein
VLISNSKILLRLCTFFFLCSVHKTWKDQTVDERDISRINFSLINQNTYLNIQVSKTYYHLQCHKMQEETHTVFRHCGPLHVALFGQDKIKRWFYGKRSDRVLHISARYRLNKMFLFGRSFISQGVPTAYFNIKFYKRGKIFSFFSLSYYTTCMASLIPYTFLTRHFISVRYLSAQTRGLRETVA